MSDAVTHFRQQFEQISPQLPGAELAWLNAARREALDQFAEDGYPSHRLEDWKYARLAPIISQAFQATTTAQTQSLAQIPDRLSLADTYQMVFLNGHYNEHLSHPPRAHTGVHIRRLAELLKSESACFKSLLVQDPSTVRHGFNALNRAFAHDSVVIELDSEQTLDQPLHLLFLTNASTDPQAPVMLHPQVLVSLASHSRLQIIESHVGMAPGVYLNNCATHAVLEPGAHLRHYKLQNEAPGAFHISSLDVRQGADSHFSSHSISLGGAVSRHEINVALDGPGAHCELNGLYMGKARQYVDYHTRIDHLKPHCSSSENYKGVLDDSAQGVFNGRVYVHPHAQKTDAQQSNQNLLLSPTAEVDTKPQLEIYADDVKCSHGATTGQLDETMIFYLRSRGISEDAAKALLTYGFARDIVDRIDVPAFHDAAALALLDGMPDSAHLRSMIA